MLHDSPTGVHDEMIPGLISSLTGLATLFVAHYVLLNVFLPGEDMKLWPNSFSHESFLTLTYSRDSFESDYKDLFHYGSAADIPYGSSEFCCTLISIGCMSTWLCSDEDIERSFDFSMLLTFLLSDTHLFGVND